VPDPHKNREIRKTRKAGEPEKSERPEKQRSLSRINKISG